MRGKVKGILREIAMWVFVAVAVVTVVWCIVSPTSLQDNKVLMIKEGDYKLKNFISTAMGTDINIVPKDKKDISFLVPVDEYGEDIYYITEYGERYHKRECRYLSFEPYGIGIDDAREHGYTGCRVCIEEEIRDKD